MPILIIFGVEVSPMEKLGNPKSFCSRTPRGSVMGVSNFAIFGIPPILNDHVLASTNDKRLGPKKVHVFFQKVHSKT